MNNQFVWKDIKMIVGLGNVGKRYTQTKHNIGFMFLNYLADKKKLEFKKKEKFYGKIVNWNNKFFIKPCTFMNNSGLSVKALKNYYDIEKESILIVHDDLDICFGKYKMSFAKGPREHNGLISIYDSINTEKFWHLRLGIENRIDVEKQYISGRDYVLTKFSAEEKKIIMNIFNDIYENYMIKI